MITEPIISPTDTSVQTIPNGPGAAALLAAGIAFLALGVLALAGDASLAIARAFNWWRPTGPLSGVTLSAIIVWLVAWFILSKLWAWRDINMAKVAVISFIMLGAGLLLTFPPFMDMLQGK
jgi:hypothetical protein